MEEPFPKSVDVIVLGTGLPEAILASACSRSGLSVLHLDRNEYYGAEWASFTMTSINDFLNETNPIRNERSDVDISSFLESDETLVELGDRKLCENIDEGWIEQPESEEGIESPEKLLASDFRKFSIDLLPKTLLSRGSMVNTLCDSQVSNYAEFKLISQICPVEDDGKIVLHPVPCSKGEIFKSTFLTMMEKRTLMKFHGLCIQWKLKSEGDEKEIIGEFTDKPFAEFLKSIGYNEKLQNIIINTIGILQPKPNTLNGMEAACQFMDSVGYFGPSPFLFPVYGCGELTQAFCRLSAVFGSLYCLGRPVQSLITKENKIVAVIADGQRIDCKHVIMSARYVPSNIETSSKTEIDRIIYVTKKSINKDEKEQISLMNAAALRPDAEITRIIEAGYEACTAPKGYFLVHGTGTKDSEKTVKSVVDRILNENDIQPLWKLSFNTNSMKFDSSSLFENMTISPNVDANVHYAKVIEDCVELFCKLWPDRDFLPRSIRKDEDEDHITEEVDNKD